MELSKQRLEALSDGVIAIIMTIMVLNIPMPEALNSAGVWELAKNIFVYFLSFVVVGAFWSQHHRIFAWLGTENVSKRMTAINLLFLFFLSLIPILTKWVMENPGKLLPAIGYDLIYLCVYVSYMFLFGTVMHQSNHEKIRQMREMRAGMPKPSPSRMLWQRFGVTAIVVVILVALSICIPRMSTFVLLGLPVLSAIGNLLFEAPHPHEKIDGKRIGDEDEKDDLIG